MIRLIFICLAFLAAFYSSAQENNPLINSGKLIDEAIERHDKGNYKEAINLYRKISRGDTNYYRALYELAYSQSLDSQYNEAIRSCEAGLAEENDQWPQFFTLYGNLTDDMGNTERALRIYDSAIALYPAYTDLYLNKGTSLLKLKKYAEAESVFKQCLLINPYQASSHYQLGLCVMQEGKIIQSFMCFINYLLVQPAGRYKGSCINLMSSICKSKDDVLEIIKNRTGDQDESFATIEKIVLSKIALDQQYKPIPKLDDVISRQIQVMFEKLEYDENNTDFWMQYYVPLFKNIFNDKKFEPFINRIFADVNVDIIQDYIKKNKKELDAVVNYTADYYNQLRATRELNYMVRKGMDPVYQYDNNKLYGKGHIKSDGETLTGAWEFYYSAGNLRSKGAYTEKGEKEGDWQYFHFNGKLRGRQTFKDGRQEGKEIFYFDNGIVSSEAEFTNGEENGLSKSFFRIGVPRIIAHVSHGKLEGERQAFFSSGTLQTVERYTGDSLDGAFITYYNTGVIESQGTYANGKLDGNYKSFHENGKLSQEGTYGSGKPQGVWKEYHQNGKLKSLQTLVDGLTEGEYTEYYDNGQLYYKANYKKGKAFGNIDYFDDDGKRYSTFTFDNDLLKMAKYFDKSGKEISSSERKSKTFNLTRYSPDGFKHSDAIYNDKGDLNGLQVYYYKSGKKSNESNYKDGQREGLTIDYFPGGNKQAEVTYSSGDKHGYQKSWFIYGQLQEEGWYQEGSLQGTWLTYDEQGNLSIRSEYLNNNLEGYKEEFFPNGKKDNEARYKLGWMEQFVQYDTMGKEINRCDLRNGNGKFRALLVNGKLYAEGNYVDGDFDGSYKFYYFDGSLSTQQFYKKGLLDSFYRNYYYGGTLSAEGQYKSGKKTGTWKNYFPDGHLNYVTNYVDGQEEGKKTYYFENGKPDTEIEMEKGNRQGWTKVYDPDGSLVYQLRYDDDEPVAYTYEDKSGKLVPEISIPGGNGKVKSYFANGNPSASFEFADGKTNGPNILYYSNGRIRKQSTDSYNLFEGSYKYYYPNGQVQKEYTFLHDNLDGSYKEYNEKGIVTEEGNYFNGSAHRLVKIYDDNGKLKQTRNYYFGKLLDVKK